MFDFVALDGLIESRYLGICQKKNLDFLFNRKKRLLFTPGSSSYIPVHCGDHHYQEREKKNQPPSRVIPSGMFTPNCSVGMCYPTSFLNRLSVLESLQVYTLILYSLSTLHLFGGCGSNMSLEYLLSKQCEGERKLLFPTRKLDNGIRCLCFFFFSLTIATHVLS